MRNLINFYNIIAKNSLLAGISNCQVVTESYWKNTQIFLVNQELDIYSTEVKNGTLSLSLIANLRQLTEISPVTKIIGFQIVFNVIYVTLSNGTFILLPIPFDLDESVIIKAELHDLSYISWSPDLERTIGVLNSSKELAVLSITNDECEKLTHICLRDLNDETNVPVNVGWGSKETQFRGSEGKFCPKIGEKDNEALNSDVNDAVSITWKKDGGMFAVSFKDDDGCRKVKIFDRNGVLLNMTKEIFGLEAALDWCPCRSVIANVQKLRNKKVICFLEPNGLRHREFELTEDVIDVKKLSWNNDGSILAVDCGDFIQLWTTSNYKWFVKIKLELKELVLYLQWDDIVSNRLHLIFANGVYRAYEWAYDVIEEPCEKTNIYESRQIAVINGCKVSVTPYGKVFPPPSLPSYTWSFACNVNSVTFHRSQLSKDIDEKSCNILLYFSDNTVLPLDKFNDINGDSNDRYVFRLKDRKIKFHTSSEMYCWLWLDNILYFSWTRLDGHYFCAASLCHQSRSCNITNVFKVDSPTVAIIQYRRNVLIHTESGAVMVYKNGRLALHSTVIPEPCRRLAVLDGRNILALSCSRNLYLNSVLKWRNVKCFYWRPPFLVILTSANRLLMMKDTDLDHQPKSVVNFQPILDRRVETKSNLISVIGDQVVLQMDRGNTEVIRPRPFVVNKMARLLSNRRYLDAFKLLRKQRINSNILFDHQPAEFLEQVENVVCDVSDPFYLTLFIMELENDNVASRMMPWKYDRQPLYPDKVHVVCQVFRDLFIAQLDDRPDLILPLICTLVRLNDLATASTYAVDHKQVSFLFQLVDSRVIYEAVLLSYDLAYALKIAEFSKMNPADYLPFIKSLQNVDDSYKKFAINDLLGRRAEALKYLANCSDDHFEESINYIEKHRLYDDAYRVFANKWLHSVGDCKQCSLNQKYFRVVAMCAEHHYKLGHYELAAVLYEKARITDKALDCYLRTGDVHSTLSLINRTSVGKSDANEAYLKLQNCLISKRQFKEAAFVSFVLLKDYATATEYYLTARLYAKALNTAKTLGGFVVASSVIKSKLIEDAECYKNDFITSKNTIEQHLHRLNILKAKESNPECEDNDDNLSTCESYSSSGSEYSTSTSSSKRSTVTSSTTSAKRARRRERKLWNLKPGNPREKPSLLNAIRDLVLEFKENSSPRVVELFDTLRKIDELEEAENLKEQYQLMVKFMSQVSAQVWNVNELTEEGGFKDIVIKVPPDFLTSTNSHLPDSFL